MKCSYCDKEKQIILSSIFSGSICKDCYDHVKSKKYMEDEIAKILTKMRAVKAFCLVSKIIFKRFKCLELYTYRYNNINNTEILDIHYKVKYYNKQEVLCIRIVKSEYNVAHSVSVTKGCKKIHSVIKVTQLDE